MKKLLLAIVLASFAFLGKAHDIELDGFYFNITSLTDLTVALTCNENDIDEMMKEVRLSLLEADVNYKVVKSFIADVKEKAMGEKS